LGGYKTLIFFLKRGVCNLRVQKGEKGLRTERRKWGQTRKSVILKIAAKERLGDKNQGHRKEEKSLSSKDLRRRGEETLRGGEKRKRS